MALPPASDYPPSPASSTSSLISLTSGLKTTSSRGPKPRFIRRLDLLCCSIVKYFPLLIIYGATAWAVWVEAWSISFGAIGGFKGKLYGFGGIFLYVMLIWSYTVATFSRPGSPLDNKHSYSHLPTTDFSTTSVTVKSSGEERFCKKCQCRKPDRTHHCSTCNCCVLKMDHHCPWLANCLGLNNYKPFVLFISYLSIFCLYDCAVSSTWIYSTIFKDEHYMDAYMPINWVMLAVISGIVGLVLSGFSIWHYLLILRAETTIESLEKTRYTSPLRRRGVPPEAHLMQSPLDHSHPHHRPLSPDMQARRERERYNAYIIEETSKDLPNAFDLGKRRNFEQVFGDKWLLWGVPVRNSLGDGWTWETSEKWKKAQRDITERRHSEMLVEHQRSGMAGWGVPVENTYDSYSYDTPSTAPSFRPSAPPRQPSWPARKNLARTPSAGSGSSKASRILGAKEEEFSGGLGGSRYSPKIAAANRDFSSTVLMQDLKPKPMGRDELSEDDDDDDNYEVSSDEMQADARRKNGSSKPYIVNGLGISGSNNNDDNDDNWAEGW